MDSVNKKAEMPRDIEKYRECVVEPLRLKARSEPWGELKSWERGEKYTSSTIERETRPAASAQTTVKQSKPEDEGNQDDESEPKPLSDTSSSSPPPDKLAQDPAVILWQSAVATFLPTMHLPSPVPNFSHPIEKPSDAHLPLSSTSLHKDDAAKYFPPPSPPPSHLDFNLSPIDRAPSRRANYRLEAHFPFTPLQRMKRKHRKRLYGALFALFYVSTLGLGVALLIYGFGGDRGREKGVEDGVKGEAPQGGGTLWMICTGGALLGCHAVFAIVMFGLYGPWGRRRKRMVRDGRGGAVEVPRTGHGV